MTSLGPRRSASSHSRKKPLPLLPRPSVELTTLFPKYNGEPLTVGRAIDILESLQEKFPETVDAPLACPPERLLRHSPPPVSPPFHVATFVATSREPSPTPGHASGAGDPLAMTSSRGWRNAGAVPVLEPCRAAAAFCPTRARWCFHAC